MTKRATAGLGAGVLLLAGLLAGCGDDDGGSDFADKSYDDIKKAAIDAMGGLKAVHVEASITSEGTEAVLDLSMSEDGSCTGEVGFGDAGAEVLQTADGAWFKPNEGLLQQQFGDEATGVIDYIGDKWVVDTSGQVVPSNCDLEEFIEQVTSDEEGEEDTEVAGTEDVDGAETVKLTFTNDDGDGTAYILTDEPHYIAKFEMKGDDGGAVTFSDFDEDVDAQTPSSDDVVDLADYQG